MHIFKKWISCAIMIASLPAFGQVAGADATTIQSVRDIRDAFKSDDLVSLDRLSKSSNPFISNLASSTAARARLDLVGARRGIEKCLALKAVTGIQKYMHIVCTTIAAVTSAEIGNEKWSYYYNDQSRCNYQSENEKDLLRTLGRPVVSAMMASCHKLRGVQAWPDSKFKVANNWRSIPAPGGYVTVVMDGVDVKLMVDTGTSNITLNRHAADKLGLLKKLESLHATEHLIDSGPGSDGELFLIRTFQLGPISARNVYVSVSDKQSSAIGINILAKLRHFDLLKDSLRNDRRDKSASCQPMRLYQPSIVIPGTTPLVRLDTAAGTFKFILDTGYRTSNMAPVSLFVFPDVAKNLFHSSKVERQSAGELSFRQNGRASAENSSYFTIRTSKDYGYGWLGLVDFNRYASQRFISGTVGYNILLNRSVFFDYPHKIICLNQM